MRDGISIAETGNDQYLLAIKQCMAHSEFQKEQASFSEVLVSSRWTAFFASTL
jgi:hypothetical protein